MAHTVAYGCSMSRAVFSFRCGSATQRYGAADQAVHQETVIVLREQHAWFTVHITVLADDAAPSDELEVLILDDVVDVRSDPKPWILLAQLLAKPRQCKEVPDNHLRVSERYKLSRLLLCRQRSSLRAFQPGDGRSISHTVEEVLKHAVEYGRRFDRIEERGA